MLAAREACLYFGKNSMLFLFASLSFFGLREFLSQVPTRVTDRRVLFYCFLAIPIQFFLIYKEWLFAFVCFVPIYGLTVIAVRLILTGKPKGFVLALSTFQLALVTTVYSVGHIAYLALLRNDAPYEIVVGGVLFLVGITQVNDVFQFLSGKAFGRRKIVPLISPKKTVEGFLGGVILSSTTAAFLAPILTPLNHWQGVLAGACLSTFGFFGDVLLSAIKRDLEIKDFSKLIPGHGGILDRIDSLVISAPLFFHLMKALLGGVS